MFRGTIRRGRLTVPIACSLIATMLPFSAATVDAVSNPPTLDALPSTRTRQDAATGEWVEPAPADPLAADAAAPDQAMAPAPTEEGVEPAATEPVPDTASKEALTDPSAADPEPANGATGP